MTITVKEFFQQFQDDAACLDHLFNIRFGQGFKCLKCEREAQWYALKNVRAYVCQWCGHHIHPTVGTPFEASRTSLQSWFFAIYLFTTTRHGVSAKELQRQLGVTYKAAWRMGQEIRKHMAEVDGEDPLSGSVEIDETYIGGKKKGKRGRGANGKTVLFGMMQRDGDVMTKVVPNVKRKTLAPIISENVAEGSDVHTDELRSYAHLGNDGYNHNTVQHGAGQYVNGNTHVNSMEGYWSNLKKSITSTHTHVSQKYLNNYAKEFEYRFNSRKNPDQMLPELLSSFSKPSKK